mmetsp:Transcript_88046/g.282571  ORF Transcript_88046/g.282571 Transcript_88046/m.282571 type:complete len:381 (-) Transcript_88046:210-1352(-)
MAGAVEVARRTDLEEMRRRGVRPNAPNYRDTPLLSIGKLVRVQVAAGRWRRATIECHDEGDGTVDVLFMNTGTAGPGQLADTEIAAEEEATLPVSAVRPLEEFEVQTEPELRLAFAEDLFATAARVKDEANCLFKLPDYEAAVEHYALAIDELRRFSSGTASSSTQVLVNQAGVLRKGTVTAINSESERADVELVDLQSGQRQVVRGAPCRTLVVVREEQLQLQTALYMNRARSLMQLSRQQASKRTNKRCSAHSLAEPARRHIGAFGIALQCHPGQAKAASPRWGVNCFCIEARPPHVIRPRRRKLPRTCPLSLVSGRHPAGLAQRQQRLMRNRRGENILQRLCFCARRRGWHGSESSRHALTCGKLGPWTHQRTRLRS